MDSTGPGTLGFAFPDLHAGSGKRTERGQTPPPMKLFNLKSRIAAILPDERNPEGLTWAEFLSVIVIVVVAVLAVVCAVVY